MTVKFGMFGNGKISERHKKAIGFVGGELVWISDPAFLNQKNKMDNIDKNVTLFSFTPPLKEWDKVDYIIICSPTPFHREQCKIALQYNKQVICEKPLCLPWEPIIDDDRINICLQLRYINDLPDKADAIKAIMVRDDDFFKSWKGDFLQAGGNIYEFFIHYADLSIILGSDFYGEVLPKGKQIREIIWRDDEGKEQKIDLMSLNMQSLYNCMYQDIVQGGGIKPKDVFYLTWVLNQATIKFGYRTKGKIFIEKEML